MTVLGLVLQGLPHSALGLSACQGEQMVAISDQFPVKIGFLVNFLSPWNNIKLILSSDDLLLVRDYLLVLLEIPQVFDQDC